MASNPDVTSRPDTDLSVACKVRRHHNGGSVVACALVVSLITLLVPAAVSAQYFGRNKVQYKDLNFQVLKTEHFDIYFYPQGRAGVDISARLAERWYARLSRIFEYTLRGRQPLVLYASHPDFEQTKSIQDELSEGTGGVTEPLRRRIVLPLGGPLADTDHVIGHELVHAFQFDMTTNPNAAPGQSGINRLPLWFIEGMASTCRSGRSIRTRRCGCAMPSRQDTLPAIEKLDDPKYFPYRWGQAFWAYIGGRWGDQVIRQMLRDRRVSRRRRRRHRESTRHQDQGDVGRLARGDSPRLRSRACVDDAARRNRAAGDQGHRVRQRFERRARDQS